MGAARVRINGEQPRVHPNGFIQLDLNPMVRLHVWPDGEDIPRQDVVTTIHDHRFDMHSTVLRGELVQHEHMVTLTPTPFLGSWTHEIYAAQYPADRKQSVLGPTGVKVALARGGATVVAAGDSYSQSRYTFHDTEWRGLTATLMTKSREDQDHDPRVLVPLGLEPDNSFVRARADGDLLWDYIERALA